MSEVVDAAISGLTQQEAEKRLETYGPNVVAGGKKRSRISMFLSYFKSPLVIILLIAGSISGLTGDIGAALLGFRTSFLVALTFTTMNPRTWVSYRNTQRGARILKNAP